MGEILFLVHRIPYPPDRGDRIRSYHILRHLAARAPVHVVGFVDRPSDLAKVAPLRKVCSSMFVDVRRSRISAGLRAMTKGDSISLTAFRSRAMKAEVKRLLKKRPIDTIFAYSGQMAQFVPEDRGGRRFVMDFVDVDSEKFASYGAKAGGPKGWIHRREGELLQAFEIETAERADVSLFVSEAEAAVFRRISGQGVDKVKAVDNGIDTDYFDPAAFPRKDEQNDPLIVFTGQMDYKPNVDAVEHFAKRTFRAIRAKHPNAVFAIVGRDPTPAVKALANRNVIITGEVPDVRPWLAAATVVVAPLEIARGIQNKVLEAMAMARPVVVSQPAFEGLDAEPGKHLIVAERLDLANAVSDLIRDPAAAEAMGRTARQWMIERYGWDAQLAALDAMIGLDATDGEVTTA
ncbi:TIGR03087 family PEP-CTERM/XrtA system glycosyltransferase [Sphingomonas montanisoli]|uniref:TIGR03087 family PEP-CTERM/XrtA system glycosyltransferase n=2 Tax=Sphingomonas montanisoli TaxID=2606412 RepID=A0A5D9CCQ3_9SPHN|nr:TIGR03087 family PEP-CTERM/XrtA system glycosyltransferase [Sphingomonas montanisoli]